MSYRSSSYRKMSKVVEKANDRGEAVSLITAEMDRVLHWTDQPPLPKPPGWGKPKASA